MQDVMKRKYTCDRSVTVTRLEDLLQDAADEKEQLVEFKTHLEGLKRRAKTVVLLKPRNPATPIKGKQPVQAVCDFKQMEVCIRTPSRCDVEPIVQQVGISSRLIHVLNVGDWVSGASFNQGVGGSITGLVDVSLSKTLKPELLPAAVCTVCE
ncbi:Plectin [Liparis tanakae]|uniref:Plectin n=1 Tax=Liparis tanakae TaxID=230148 RepID=A0A4Z2E0G1_9TELE|nr:Plectin [Liparis tanakae]